jgi:hypothetical protein
MNPNREVEMRKFLKFLLRKVKPINAKSATITKRAKRKVTFILRKVKPINAKSATQLVTEYRVSGLGSNRAEWSRITALLAAVMTATETNSAVDITALFPANASDKQYHTAHRALNAGIIRPLRHNVRIVVLESARVKGDTVEGETTTTGKGMVLVVPAK